MRGTGGLTVLVFGEGRFFRTSTFIPARVRGGEAGGPSVVVASEPPIVVSGVLVDAASTSVAPRVWCLTGDALVECAGVACCSLCFDRALCASFIRAAVSGRGGVAALASGTQLSRLTVTS